MCIFPPPGGATACWTGFEHRNHFFKARRSRHRLLRGYFTQNAPKRYSTRCSLCCPDAHPAFTRFPPSLGHRDRINELPDLEIGWVRTAWVRGHPLPLQFPRHPRRQYVSQFTTMAIALAHLPTCWTEVPLVGAPTSPRDRCTT